MSGFSAEWLALREPADHAARSRDLLRAVAARFAAKAHVSIVDLGAGAGSNLRAIAPALAAERQSWTLVDHDPALLLRRHPLKLLDQLLRAPLVLALHGGQCSPAMEARVSITPSAAAAARWA